MKQFRIFFFFIGNEDYIVNTLIKNVYMIHPCVFSLGFLARKQVHGAQIVSIYFPALNQMNRYERLPSCFSRSRANGEYGGGGVSVKKKKTERKREREKIIYIKSQRI